MRGDWVASSPGFTLVNYGWEQLLDEAMAVAGERLRIICPFIKTAVVERLLRHGTPASIEILTRFDTRAFCDGVSDVQALACLLERGARVRGVRNLHAKVYQFGRARTIVTSANLTRAALRSNHEFGFVADDPDIIERCNHYFDDLWAKAEPDLTPERLATWQKTVQRYHLRGAPPGMAGLGDEGADIGLPEAGPDPVAAADLPSRAFVKFFGNAGNRVVRSWRVLDEVARAGCHWACTYPKGKRPRQVEDGSIMFMARLVTNPDDIIVFGQAIGLRHKPVRDDATPDDIVRRHWKSRWPHYVRVHSGRFVAGTLEGGVSLNAIMDELGPNTFASTQQNARIGYGNTNPRRSYMRQAHVELSPQGYQLISQRLEAAFARYGTLPQVELENLDWPE